MALVEQINERCAACKPQRSLNLRVGEWVEVRSAEEILATLGEDKTLDALPFMPEMLKYCGKRFRVFRSAHKTSDTIEIFAIRKMANAVHLEGLRCDGAAHGGCQAGCLLFWKESWLKRVSGDQAAIPAQSQRPFSAEQGNGSSVAAQSLYPWTKQPGTNGQPGQYRCQATEMLKATTEVRKRGRFNPLFYVKDLTSGNVKLLDFIRYGSLAMLNAFLLRWFNRRFPYLRGLAGEKTPTVELHLQPGELVRVRTKEEIMRTLSPKFRNRGLWFDVEMVPFCGKGDFKVLRRVDTIINEKTGELVRLSNPCILLEGVTCLGYYSHRRMFSPRHEYHFWREIWLERVTTKQRSSPVDQLTDRSLSAMIGTTSDGGGSVEQRGQ